jgi:ketosteroid isomerase-like protein
MMADVTAGDEVRGHVARLQEAINDHDLEALVDSFADDYTVEMPAHPRRAFAGREQVRHNWEQILAGVPDLSARIVGLISDGDSAWVEWDWRGTRVDGSPHHLRGVTIIGVRDGRIGWSRFFMEPVDVDGAAIDESIRESLAAGVKP